VWSVQSGSLVRTFEGHTHHVLDVSLRHDGRVLALGGRAVGRGFDRRGGGLFLLVGVLDLFEDGISFELLRHRGYVRSPDGFVFTVFRARCARFVRAASNRRRVFAGGSGETEACDPLLPEGVDRQVALREALSGISAACRRLLAAYYIEGRSLREAAYVVSLQYSSVPKTINRCLKKLRACFA